jgi:actin cytoskeleton-regulatory complex protein PAN1
MGGGNSARPGQPPFAGQQQQMPYGQQQQPQYGQQPQQAGYGQQQAQTPQQQPPQYGLPAQQQPFLTAQSTGFVAPLQPQYTAYPQQQQQPAPQQPAPQQPPVPQQQFPQYTAQQQPGQFQPQSQMQQQAPIQQQPTAFQQPQQSQQPQNLAPPSAPQQAPQPTGMTSSQVANSFRGSSSQPVSAAAPTGGSKIPNIRLSFITATDQAKFEQLFKSAVGTGQSMTGDQARDLLMRSKLNGDALAHIWSVIHSDSYHLTDEL